MGFAGVAASGSAPVRGFMAFAGIAASDDFRLLRRAHVLAWRHELEERKLAPATIRRKLAALSSLFEFLCERNAVTDNPVRGVRRPRADVGEGKTPAVSDAQARALLDAPQGDSLEAVRDRAILAVLLYLDLRREELCRLKVGDYSERRGMQAPHPAAKARRSQRTATAACGTAPRKGAPRLSRGSAHPRSMQAPHPAAKARRSRTILLPGARRRERLLRESPQALIIA